MTTQDLSITLQVDQAPEEVFTAITNVRGWWSEAIEGHTQKLDDEFTYRHKDMHRSTQRLVEQVPAQKVVWLVTDSHLSFIQNPSEWTGTRLAFEIFPSGNTTLVRFTHEGLTTQHECFNACSKGWDMYINHSLRSLITTGKGQPDKKESTAKTESETV